MPPTGKEANGTSALEKYQLATRREARGVWHADWGERGRRIPGPAPTARLLTQTTGEPVDLTAHDAGTMAALTEPSNAAETHGDSLPYGPADPECGEFRWQRGCPHRSSRGRR